MDNLSCFRKQLKSRSGSESSVSTTGTLSGREYHGAAPSVSRGVRTSPPGVKPTKQKDGEAGDIPQIPREEQEPPLRPPKSFKGTNADLSGITPHDQGLPPPPQPPKSALPPSHQRPGIDTSRVSPYETVSIVPPRPPKPGAATSSVPEEIMMYQQPSSLAAPPSRCLPTPPSSHEATIYDNASIRNMRASTMASNLGEVKIGSSSAPHGPVSGFSDDGPPTPIDYSSVDEQKDDDVGKAVVSHNRADTVDDGGMGCQTIEEAVHERRRHLKEVEKHGVVLLSVAKTDTPESPGKATCHSTAGGQCECCLVKGFQP